MRRFFAASLLIIAVAGAQTPPDLSSLKDNSPVSVREGDAWSAGTFVRKEGRRFLVKYEDGTEEWVGADRLKIGPPTAAEKPADKATPATQPAAAKLKSGFVVGDAAEVKWGGRWDDCEIVEGRGDWTLIHYTGWTDWHEWVEPWRLRKPGSTYDLGHARPNGRIKRDGDLPRPAVGAPPAGIKNANARLVGTNNPAGEKVAGDKAAKPGEPAKKNDPFAAPSGGLAVTDAVRTGRDILPVAGDTKYTPAAGPRMGGGAPTALPPLSDRWSKYKGLQIVGATAMVPVGSDFGDDKKSGLIKVTLGPGTAAGVMLNAASYPLAISPNGQLVACRSNGFHGGTKKRLDVYKIAGKTATHAISFVPGEADRDDIEDAVWVDDKLVVVLAGDELACWDYATATSLWRMGVKSDSIARSGDGRTIAVGTSEGVALIEAATGNVTGVLDGEPPRQISLSPDGKTLVGIDGTFLSVWDLATLARAYRMGLPPGLNGRPTAIDGEFALIGDYLFSLAKKTVIWRYDGGDSVAAANGRVFSVFSDNKTNALVSAAIPHPAAAKAAKAAPAATMVLSPGVKVSLDLQHEGTEEQRQSAAKAITARLAEAGIGVEPGQPVRVASKTEAGQPVTRQYRKIGVPGAPVETVTITTKITTLSVQAGDKVLWTQNSMFSNDPGSMVRLQENQTVQDEANRRGVSNDWISQAAIPTLLAAPVDLAAVPTSRWALGGIKDK